MLVRVRHFCYKVTSSNLENGVLLITMPWHYPLLWWRVPRVAMVGLSGYRRWKSAMTPPVCRSYSEEITELKRSQIRHSKTPAGKTPEEWKSVDELARSTIRMHLAKKFYFSIAKEKTVFELCEKLQSLYEKKSSSSKLILIRQLFCWDKCPTLTPM